nr:immunoglobulin heavy chain junction region [Macaca mulatta]MOX68899.1 immunoglobulin heavy chain junction region [Macaca mulatta]
CAREYCSGIYCDWPSYALDSW